MGATHPRFGRDPLLQISRFCALCIASWCLVGPNLQGQEMQSPSLELEPSEEHAAISEQRGQELLSKLQDARQAVQAHPSSAAGYFSLAVIQKQLGETEKAIESFDRALQINSRLAEVSYERGLIEADQQKWMEADGYFRQALAASPDHVRAHLAHGEMILRLGDFDAAAREFSTVVRLDRFNSSARYGIGLVRLQQGDLAAAESEFRQALSFRPRAVPVQESLGKTLVREHKWNEALPVLRDVLAANQTSIEVLNALATTLEHRGDKAGAAEEFKRVRELSRQELLLHRTQGQNNQGLVYWHAGHLEDAAAAFRSAIQMKPDYAEAHNNLGGVLWQLNDSAPALAEFQAAVRYSPNFAEAHNNWGSVLLHAREFSHAIEQFRAALAIRPGFALAHLNLGHALVGEHNLDSAETEFRDATMLVPEMAAAHAELGLLIAARHGGLSQDARAELEEALRLDSGLKSSIPAEYLQKLQ